MSTPNHSTLDDRKEEILREIVESFIQRGEPVGSRSVADASDLGVSSATIRNEMGVLESEGYISHPHTSAGRVPTDKGYRYYVDVLAPKVAADPARQQEIEGSLRGAFSAIDELLERASDLLVELTDYTSLATPPAVDEARLDRVELVGLGGSRVLLVCVGRGGWHEERVLELGEEPDAETVARAAAKIREAISGRTLEAAAAAIEQVELDDQTRRLAVATADGLRRIAAMSARLVTGGASRLVVWEPADRARRVLELLEGGGERFLPMADPHQVTVRIGQEMEIGDLQDLSLIAAGYRFGRTVGSLGVLGPTRMDYPTVISTVAEVASTLSKLLRRIDA